jgi:hypothetical protein
MQGLLAPPGRLVDLVGTEWQVRQAIGAYWDIPPIPYCWFLAGEAGPPGYTGLPGVQVCAPLVFKHRSVLSLALPPLLSR